jgi:hypothetical protein
VPERRRGRGLRLGKGATAPSRGATGEDEGSIDVIGGPSRDESLFVKLVGNKGVWMFYILYKTF